MKTPLSAGLFRFKWLVLPMLLLLSMHLSGCQAIRFLVFGVAPTGKGQWVPAQCEVLSKGKRVLVLVYADQAIQYQQEQLARYNTAAFAASELQSKLKVEVVDPAAVEHFQAANINWANQPLSKIGQRFHADYVLYIELLEFTTAAEESGELLRGRIAANASLYPTGTVDQQLWQGNVGAVYPPDNPEVAGLGVAQRISDETLKLFAEHLVKCFYGHYEPL